MPMHQSLQAVLTDLAEGLRAVIAQYQNADEQGAKQQKAAADKLVQLLLEKGLAYRATAVPDDVGVHPDNRFGSGVEWHEVHILAGIIIRSGWSWSEVKDPVAIEVGNGDEGSKQVRFNEELVASSEGYLARVSNTMKMLSIACSHTNQVLRCILHCTKSYETEFVNEDGYISQDAVFRACTSIKEAMETGLTWIVIRAEVVAEVPDLAAFLSESHNIGHGSHRLQSKVQTLMQIHAKMIRVAHFGNATMPSVVRDIERTRPYLKGQVDAMATYVQNFGGGNPPVFLQELKAFAKTLGDNTRDVGSVTFSMLGKARLSQVPEWVTACMKASLGAPEQYMRDGGVRLITSSDVQAVESGKLRSMAFDAVAKHRSAVHYLKEGRKVTDAHLFARLIGELDARMVMTTYGKKARGRKQFDDLDSVVQQFVHDVRKVWPAAAHVEPPWQVTVSDEPKIAVAAMVQYDSSSGSSGHVVKTDILESKGFELKAKVKGRSGANVEGTWVILELGEDKVKLVLDDGTPLTRLFKEDGTPVAKKRMAEHELQVSASKLVDDFEVISEEESTVVQVTGGTAIGLLNKEVMSELKRAFVRAALDSAYKEYAPTVELTITFAKSGKKVVADKRYAKGQLELIPLTPNIGYGAKMPQNGIAVNIKMPEAKHEMWLLPKTTLPGEKTAQFIVPCWCIPSTPDTAKVNVAWSTVRVMVSTWSAESESKRQGDVVCVLPAMTNTRAIEKGSELFQKGPDAGAAPKR
ncbi:unnamed protein product [Prorocentrum cordatum]|uniref:Uncharacterized protein n=1 Tax=Prorocentrum cordatum TaxID=2364126 RepID=A0ABN9SQP4_9DINO|nr:unnamed protein product [Polarella glacialis]